jgi:uncharacterized protein (TIRG00374 family)
VKPTAPPKHSIAKTMFTILRLGLGGAILIYMYRLGIISLRPLEKLLTAWPVTMAGVGILLADIYLMGIRTCWMFEPVGLHLPIWKSFQLNLVASFFTNVIPGAAGGDVARIVYTTKGNPGNRAKVATVVLLDRGVGLFSMLLLPLLFAPFFIGLLRTVPVLRDLIAVDAVAAIAMLIGFVSCVYNESLRRIVAPGSSRWERWRAIARRVLNTLSAYRDGTKPLLAALAMSVVANASVILVMALALVPINPAWLSTKMCLLVPIGQVANVLPLTPGGLGVGEAAFHSLFEMSGLQGGAESVIVWRIWRAVVGLMGLGVYLGGLGRVVFDQPAGSEADGEA